MSIKDFLSTSYTAFHAVENVKTRLKQAGFTELDRGEKWTLSVGGKYYTDVNGSAIFAFRVGDKEGALTLACAHTDSPCLKVKGRQLVDSPEGKRINVEKYGGLLLYSMLDIPLKIAGRVLYPTDDGVEERLYVSDFSVNVPSLCIHHNPEANDKLALNVQADMLPLVGDGEDLYQVLGIEGALDADLYVVPDVSPYLAGKDSRYLVSPRIDNLTGVYACIEGLINAEPKGISVVACFDNEETGSNTKQGADSDAIREIVERIARALDMDEDALIRAKRDGLVLSVDNGHAVHPAHPEKSDSKNPVYLNGGVVVKHHVNYTTDGVSSALLKAILNKEEIPYQDYYNRSDLRCGSTLGLFVSKNLVMDAVDIGLAQLAMHSAVETVGAEDVERMEKCLSAVFSSDLKKRGNARLIG